MDRRLIVASMRSPEERDWLNVYHDEVREKIMPRLTGDAQDWLQKATAAL